MYSISTSIYEPEVAVLMWAHDFAGPQRHGTIGAEPNELLPVTDPLDEAPAELRLPLIQPPEENVDLLLGRGQLLPRDPVAGDPDHSVLPGGSEEPIDGVPDAGGEEAEVDLGGEAGAVGGGGGGGFSGGGREEWGVREVEVGDVEVVGEVVV